MPENESKFLYEDMWNSFRFEPDPSHEDIATISSLAKELGYMMHLREVDYSLAEVQSALHDEGPSRLLNGTYLQHDISPQADAPAVEEFVSRRLARLAPQTELIVTDPYLFTKTPKPDTTSYVDSVVRLVSPLLQDGAAFTAVVDPTATSAPVQSAVRRALTSEHPTLQWNVHLSSGFHDRFWIADRSRGAILGSSLNKIGSKIFLIDALSDADVAAIVSELRAQGLVLT